jgi:PKD repeat protein
VQFTDESASDRPIVSWVWDFGDGATSTEVNPSHTYTTADRFDVALTVTDDAGNVDTLKAVDLIVVSRLPIPGPIIPEMFRRFVLIRTIDSAIVAYGTQFPDRRCVMFWNGDAINVLNFDDMEDVERGALEPGKTKLMWIDPGDRDDSSTGGEGSSGDALEWAMAAF